MLGYFPTPYPDELLYSIVARYHIRSGNKSFRQTHQELFDNFELCDRYFNNRVVEWEEGNFVAVSIIRELITENLARGFPWWHNFAHAVRSKDLYKLVSYERKGLQEMVNTAIREAR